MNVLCGVCVVLTTWTIFVSYKKNHFLLIIIIIIVIIIILLIRVGNKRVSVKHTVQNPNSFQNV